MSNIILKWLSKRYPQNFIIKHSLLGMAICFVFCFGFLLVYKPLGIPQSKILSYWAAMAIYCFNSAISIFLITNSIKRIKYFSDLENWTVLKECISILLVLVAMSISIYFTGFFAEEPAQRWNFSTFIDSSKYALLIGVIPFSFFTIMNSRYFFAHTFQPQNNRTFETETEYLEELIEIDSKLKKEKLKFYPNQFLYATSDGNYVVFYLNCDDKIQKEVIRNSISNVEEQLSYISFIVRTHRAFIINVKKVDSKKGNALGYQLKLSGIDLEIPVSRQNINAFEEKFAKLK